MSSTSSSSCLLVCCTRVFVVIVVLCVVSVVRASVKNDRMRVKTEEENGKEQVGYLVVVMEKGVEGGQIRLAEDLKEIRGVRRHRKRGGRDSCWLSMQRDARLNEGGRLSSGGSGSGGGGGSERGSGE